MNVSILQRSVARIDHPTEQTGMTPNIVSGHSFLLATPKQLTRFFY